MKRETLEGFPSSTDIAVHKYRTAVLKKIWPQYSPTYGGRYMSAVFLAYTTPANCHGIGTDILFGLGYGNLFSSDRVSAAPIQGFLELNLSLKVEGATLFAISLPENLSGLVDTIQDYAETAPKYPLWAIKSNAAGALQWQP